MINPLGFLINRNKKLKRIKRIIILVLFIILVIMVFAGTVYIVNILELGELEDSDSGTSSFDESSSSSTESSTGVAKLLKSADKIDKYMADNGFSYYPKNDPTFNEKYNKGSSKYSCCATYVSWCLQDAGMIKEHVNSASEIDRILNSSSNWTRIDAKDESEMKAGDVGIYIENGEYAHTNIYAGDSVYWDAGNTQKIQSYGKTSHSIPTYVYRYNK